MKSSSAGRDDDAHPARESERSGWPTRTRRPVDEAHRGGLDVWFHTDRDILEIVGDLGVDVLDPVQPGALDLGRLARDYGGKVAFSGALSVQRLASMTPDEVRSKVFRTVDLLGSPFGNALVISPTNSMMPETPPENLEAILEAGHSL